MEPFDEAHDLLDDAVRLRRLIHRHPELGLHLPRTQEAVLESLDGLGLQVRVGERTTSVTAVLDGAHPAPRSCCGRTCTRFPRTRRPGWRSPRRWMGRSTPAAPVMGAEDFSYQAAGSEASRRAEASATSSTAAWNAVAFALDGSR